MLLSASTIIILNELADDDEPAFDEISLIDGYCDPVLYRTDPDCSPVTV